MVVHGVTGGKVYRGQICICHFNNRCQLAIEISQLAICSMGHVIPICQTIYFFLNNQRKMTVWLAHLACHSDASTLKWDVQKPLEWEMVELV